jgi:hypothetical protein
MTDPVKNGDPTQQPQLENGWKRFWESGLGTSLRTQTATWFIGVVIAVLSVFSSHLTEKIKFSINRADLRVKSYETLSQDLSVYVFASENCQESIEHNLTTKDAMTPLVKDYNDAIDKLRKNEFVYRSWLSRYWGKDDVARFSDVMTSARSIDQTFHSLNDEFEAVNITKSKQKIDDERAKKAASEMRPKLDLLRSQVQTLLETSSK